MSLPAFSEFFWELWKKKPFSWQCALARWIEEKGRWPETISVPTSAGKTAVIDIAVYALARGWTAAATRMFFVVDRRLVVDEASDRANEIYKAIGKNPALEPVRAALRERCGLKAEKQPYENSDQFLQVSTMRGGMPLETAWAKSPIQPTVCLTTVDQLGSRLLFRGYGISPRVDPIHAGLAATDSLVILDEAHLSEPFRQTLTYLKGYRSERWCREMVGTGLQVTSMSATLHSAAQSEETHFEFRESYSPDETPSEVLKRRLDAPKLTTLVIVGDASASPWKKPPQSSKPELYRWRQQEPDRLAALESKCAELASEVLSLAKSPKVIGVILNRVNSARSVFRQLSKWSAENGVAADVILLTGRSRPIERKALVDKFWERIRAGRTRTADDRPIFVVATQCIEAGVNLDFDALITELASLDALRQRFGRLDRFGDFRHARAWIVGRADHAKDGDEAIYGPASKETFRLLQSLQPRARRGQPAAPINLGITELADKLPKDLATYLTVSKSAPTLMPSHLDFFAQTNPNPAPDPDPAIFLHGPKTEPEGVSIVWRADLSQDMDLWKETLSLLPPTSAEALSLPVYAAKQWLAGKTTSGVVDLDGAPASENDSRPVGGLRHRSLIWKGKKKPAVQLMDEKDLAHLKPGSVLVVDTTAGGVDEFGWNPESDALARDLADIALSRQRARPTLRLHPALISSWLDREHEPDSDARAEIVRTVCSTRRFTDDDLAVGSASGEIGPALTLIQESELVRQEIRDIAAAAKATWKSYPDGSGWICSGHKEPSKAPVFLWEDEDSSLEEDQRTLNAHAEDVAEVLKRWLEKLALPPDIAQTLSAFAPLHDIGKADPRFQDFLFGGPLESDGEPLRAKSGDGELTAEEIAKRWKACDLPTGWRHELCSLDLLEANPSLLDPIPKERRPLFRHVVGAHHGFGRILPPVINNTGAPAFEHEFTGRLRRLAARRDWYRLDSGWIDQFAALQQQFGWHGLAFLEAIVRLADHVASARLD
jgi:CRISPR-associated endonuclease/helicase Cas3